MGSWRGSLRCPASQAAALRWVPRGQLYRKRQAEATLEVPPAKPRPSPACALSEEERLSVGSDRAQTPVTV